jgi:hypothetical protein
MRVAPVTRLYVLRHRIIDTLAISWGVAFVYLFAYICDIQPPVLEMAYADFDADDFIFGTFILSILLGIFSSRFHVRSDPDAFEDLPT